jgi:hypothetical protein
MLVGVSIAAAVLGCRLGGAVLVVAEVPGLAEADGVTAAAAGGLFAGVDAGLPLAA